MRCAFGRGVEGRGLERAEPEGGSAVPQERGDELVGAVAATGVVEVIEYGLVRNVVEGPFGIEGEECSGGVAAEVVQELFFDLDKYVLGGEVLAETEHGEGV